MSGKQGSDIHNVTIIGVKRAEPEVESKLLRVAAYCRVSLLQDDQDGRIESQTQHYSNLINSTPGWIMAGIYIDNGKSGLQKYNRPGFQRLIKHCQEGRIDKVLTKSASRISRSAKDFLETVNTLRALGIGITFEREGFDTLSSDSDFLLSTFAAIAQEQSRSVSQNVSWAKQRRFANGIPTIKRVLGYNVIDHKTHVEVNIIEDEARIVREIFDLAESGFGTKEIARRMMAKGVKTANGNPVWRCQTVNYTLRNHNYTGSPLNQQRYTNHYLDRHDRINQGERPRYLIEHHHEAIVSQEQFDLVQQILSKKKIPQPAKTWIQYPMTGRFICGECGRNFQFNHKGNRLKYWRCSQRRIDASLCQMGTVRERDLEAVMKKTFFKRYPVEKSLTLKKLMSDLERINNNSDFEHARLLLRSKLEEVTNREQQCEGKGIKRAHQERVRLETELKASEQYWDQLEADRPYRDKTLAWLKALPQVSDKMDTLRQMITIELMRAFILKVTVYKSGKYSFYWFDKMITNIRTGQELISTESPVRRRQVNFSTKEISVIPPTDTITTVRIKPKRMMTLRLPPVVGVPKSHSEPGRKRVAAYCRVSNDSDVQQSSYELQIAHYTQFIRSNPDWQFAGIYADEASGTTLKNRPNFQRMIEDAKKGEIDLIISKSISRFSRSVIDFLTYTRLLKELNPPVDVFLEKENLYTLSAQSELILTLMAALAQEESLAISENRKWGIEKRYARGLVPKTKLRYGYDIDAHCNWIVNEHEASVVRRIFAECIAGKSSPAIAKGLNDNHIPRRDGQALWRFSSVAQVLHSETYMGDLILQQGYIEDYMTHKYRPNRGEKPKYHLENHHPAIIDKADWDQAQTTLARKAEKQKLGSRIVHEPEKRKRFYRVFKCSRCGQDYVLIRQGTGKYILFCKSNIVRSLQEKCHLPGIAVENLEQAFGVMLMEMKRDRARLHAETMMAIDKDRVTEEQIQRVYELGGLIERLLENLSQESVFIQNSDDADVHRERITGLAVEIEGYQAELKQLQGLESAASHKETELAWLMSELPSVKEFDPRQEMSEFREDIFNRLVKRGEMLEDFRIRLELSIGIEWTLQCMRSHYWNGFRQRIANREKMASHRIEPKEEQVEPPCC